MTSRYEVPKPEIRRKTARPVAGIAGVYVVWTGGSCLMLLAGAWMPPEMMSGWLVAFSLLFHIGLASLATTLFMVYSAESLKDRHRLRFGLISCCAALSGLFFLSTRLFTPQLPPLVHMLNTANLIVFANLTGTWMISPIKRPAELVPVCLVMALADLFSVSAGPSSKIAETIRSYQQSSMTGPPPWVEFILIKVAVPGSDALMSVFGLADWIIVVFFAAAASRFGFNDNLAGRGIADIVREGRPGIYLPVAAVGLYAAVLLARSLGVFLPALPFVAVAFLVFTMPRYPDILRLTRSDWKMTAGAAAIMATLIAVYRLVPN